MNPKRIFFNKFRLAFILLIICVILGGYFIYLFVTKESRRLNLVEALINGLQNAKSAEDEALIFSNIMEKYEEHQQHIIKQEIFQLSFRYLDEAGNNITKDPDWWQKTYAIEFIFSVDGVCRHHIHPLIEKHNMYILVGP